MRENRIRVEHVMRRTPLAAAALAALTAVAAAPRDAQAFERQHHLGLGPGLGLLKVDDKSTVSLGAGLQAHYAYGITDQFNLMAEASSVQVALNQDDDPGSPKTRPARIDSLGVGVAYVLDILQWVPYFGVLGAGYGMSGGNLDSGYKPGGGAQLALGVDYQIDRSLALGVAIRQHFILSDIKTYPTYTTGFLRVEYIWGW